MFCVKMFKYSFYQIWSFEAQDLVVVGRAPVTYFFLNDLWSCQILFYEGAWWKAVQFVQAEA